LVTAPRDTSLRIAVEEKARAFGCTDAISNLAIVDAVRFLQHKERCTPCFGWEAPLVPLPDEAAVPPGIPREKLCGVPDCYWKSPCDTYRIMPTASLEECMDEELVRDMEDAITPGAAPPDENAIRVSMEKRASEAAAAERRFSNEAAATATLARIAESAGTFLAAIQELVQQSVDWKSKAGEQLDGLTERFDQLAEVVFSQQLVNNTAQERYEEVCQAIATSREAHARHESDVQSLREGTRERMDWLAGRLDEFAGQLGEQRQQISGLQAKVDSLEPLTATVADLSSKVEGWCERLDKQGEVLHTLCEAQNQRAAVLDEFLGVLSRLRATAVASTVKL